MSVKRIVGAVLALSLIGAPALAAKGAGKPAPKPLAPTPAGARLGTLNELTKLLAPNRTMADVELERAVDTAEILAIKEAFHAPTPGAIALAASLEDALPRLEGGRPLRALLQLAAQLAVYGGPQEDLEETFWGMLLAQLKLKADEAQPRPQLGRELAEIGQWATRFVETRAAGLPADERALLLTQLAIARGNYADAAERAKKGLASSSDPRWHGWMAAALVLSGKNAEAEPFRAAAAAAGGEAERISRAAQVERVHRLALDGAAKALRAAGVAAAPPSSGGKPLALADSCRALLGAPPRKGAPKLTVKPLPAHPATGAEGEAVLACATLLWDSGTPGWLDPTLTRAPAGDHAAWLRAAGALQKMFGQAGGRPTLPERKQLLDSYLAAVKVLSIPPVERKVIMLLGSMGVSEDVASWTPGPVEKQLVDALAAEAPCDPYAFPVRAMAVRKDRPALAALLGDLAERCATGPGVEVAVQALEILLQLSYESPSPVKDPAKVASLARALGTRRSADAQAVAVHADEVALSAMAAPKESVFALQAALALYEQALKQMTPLADPAQLQRLSVNAGFLSLELARLSDPKTPAGAKGRQSYLERATLHLTHAVSLGENLPVATARALYDLQTSIGFIPKSADLKKLPPSRARNRLACLYGEAAIRRGQKDEAEAFRALANDPLARDERPFALQELLVDTVGSFNVVVRDRSLRPLVEFKTLIYLAAGCDASHPAGPANSSAPASTVGTGGRDGGITP